MKINLIGGPFQHAHSSTWWKKAKNIEWIKNTYQEDVSFYVDNQILNAFGDNFKGKKYAWIVESRQFHNMTNFAKANVSRLEKTFELIFVNDKSLTELSDKIVYVPGNGFWIETPKIYFKNKNLSMITSNKMQTEGHRLRHNIIDKYKDHMDLYGRGFKEVKLKEEALIDYRFSFAIENDNYDGYFTEKILDCFATGTIPIYWGTNAVFDYFDKDGIIMLEDFDINIINENFYKSKMEAIKNNFIEVLKYEIPEDYIYEKYLKNKLK